MNHFEVFAARERIKTHISNELMERIHNPIYCAADDVPPLARDKVT